MASLMSPLTRTHKPQSLRWRLAMVALILAGLVGIALCGGAEPVALLAHFWSGG